MKQKTIAIVINTSWNIYNFRLGLMKALHDDGYNVIAIAPTDKYSQKLEESGIKHYNINMNNKGTNPIEDMGLLFAFRKLYGEIKPDIVLQYTIKPNIYGSVAAWTLGIPVISNISGLGTVFLNKGFSFSIAQFMYKIALKIPKKVFYQNVHDRELFINSGLVDADKTNLLPGSGIDTEIFKQSRVMENEEGVVTFLFIARLLKDKGIEEFVDAARQIGIHNMQKAEFYILGSFYPGNPTAITEDEMKAWEEEGIVKYLGTSDNVKSIICVHDCIVLPSYREGLSRVLLEAASMAKPIITTNVPGCKEVVDDGVNGFLCEVKDTNSLAKQMTKMLLLTYENRKDMGKRGREKVIVEFHEKFVIDKYKEAIAEII